MSSNHNQCLLGENLNQFDELFLFQDTNFQVLKVKLEILVGIVEKMGITTTTADCILNELVTTLADAKNNNGACKSTTEMIHPIRKIDC